MLYTLRTSNLSSTILWHKAGRKHARNLSSQQNSSLSTENRFIGMSSSLSSIDVFLYEKRIATALRRKKINEEEGYGVVLMAASLYGGWSD